MIAPIFDYVRLARPHHWVKNGFVLLPIPFAIAAGAALDVSRVVGGVLGFSLLTSAVYVFNDLLDAERDRRHPKKCERPIAAGRISVGGAFTYCLALLGAGFASSWLGGYPVVPLLGAGYLALNLFYTTLGKHVAVLDVVLLAAGFVLRVLIGCAIVDAEPSSWLILCTSTIALFLALTKRRADLVTGVDAEHRPSLARYSLPWIDRALVGCALIAVASYAMYCAEAEVLDAGRRFVSVPFVGFGFLNYLVLQRRVPELSPIERLFRQPSHAVNFVGWTVATAWSLGWL